MKHPNDSSLTLSCWCGETRIVAAGPPIITVSCYCHSCQTAGQQLSRPGRPPLLTGDGGTPFVLYRKDRVDFRCSPTALREHRLSPQSTTRRIVAACCSAPLFLEFEKGHWLSVYTERLPETQRPHVEMRTMTSDARPDVTFDDGIPSYPTHSPRFMMRLLWAWVRMGFRSPKIDVKGGPLVVTSAHPGAIGTASGSRVPVSGEN